MAELRMVHVVLVSPGETDRERDLVLVAIEQVNQDFNEEGIGIQLKFDELAEPEILIGAFWTTLGATAETRVHSALTDHNSHGRPYAVVLFNQESYTPKHSNETLEWSRVLDFRDEIMKTGCAINYLGDDDFERKVLGHLKKYARQVAIREGFLTPNLPISPDLDAIDVIPDAFTCKLISTLTDVRAEGLTEPVGELGLIFSGGVPLSEGGQIQKLRLELFFNTVVTNRIESSGMSDVLLVCDSPSGTATMIRGHISGNRVAFDAVHVDPPGKGKSVSFSIRNIRVNATVLSGGESPKPTPVMVCLRILCESSSVDLLPEVLAHVHRSLRFRAVLAEPRGATRESRNSFLQDEPAHAESVGILRFTGLLPSAFKPRSEESSAEEAEYCAGTRLKAVFHNVPNGVQLSVSAKNVSRANEARLIMDELGQYREHRPTSEVDSIPVVELPVVDGSARAVWEVVKAGREADEIFDFAMFITYQPRPEVNSPSPGTATIQGSFAPSPEFSKSYAGWWSSSSRLPVPRFVPSAAPQMNLFHIAIHATRLRFCFVTNQDGFDTAITVSNITLDPFGSPPQTGSVILYFYGSNAPSPINTGAVPAGHVYTALLSSIAHGFQGYIVAVCHFYPARGYAMITDVGARNIASGYIAEILPS